MSDIFEHRLLRKDEQELIAYTAAQSGAERKQAAQLCGHILTGQVIFPVETGKEQPDE